MNATPTINREIRNDAARDVHSHDLLVSQIDQYIRESAVMSDRLIVQLLNLKALTIESRNEACSKLSTMAAQSAQNTIQSAAA
ncbi:hypothetical protein BH23VER1_BH23VER1_09430 [soil metagenome]